MESKKKKYIAFVAIFLTIVICGKRMYNSANYDNYTNWYKLPEESIEVAEIIGADEEEKKKALVPDTLTAYIRQVDASIDLAYKRDPEGYQNNEFVLEMLQGKSEQIAELAKKNNCNYIVLKKEIPLTLDMGYFGYRVLAMTDNFVIYKIAE